MVGCCVTLDNWDGVEMGLVPGASLGSSAHMLQGVRRGAEASEVPKDIDLLLWI